MYINTFKYTPEDVDCKLCTEYVKKFGCTACGCPWMAERIEAGVVNYAEVVRQMFPHDKRLMARLEPLIRDFPGMLWKDERHRQRMEGVKIHLGHSKRRDTPAFFAVMFLFTSDEDIYGWSTKGADRFSGSAVSSGLRREAPGIGRTMILPLGPERNSSGVQKIRVYRANWLSERLSKCSLSGGAAQRKKSPAMMS